MRPLRDGFRAALPIGLVLLCAADRVSPPPSASWPNEPAGMTVLTDWGFDQAPPRVGDVPIPGSPGWSVVLGSKPPLASEPRMDLVSDPTAPTSSPHVYDFVYPRGMVEGAAPGTIYFPRRRWGIQARLRLPWGERQELASDEVYVGFWWKPSAPFDLGPNGNKIAFIFNGGGETGGQQFMILMPDGRLHVLPEYPGDYRWRDPNMNATPVALGVWHRIEWYSNIKTGTLKWWLDGTLQGSHGDVTNAYKFDQFKLSPTWGGNTGAQKRETDHYWYDHIHVSVR